MPDRHINNKRSEIFFLVVLGIISIILRLYSTNQPDFYFDEAIQAMSMKDFIATGNTGDLYLFGHGPFFMLAMYMPAFLFGVTEFSIRMVEAFFGTLAVFVVYFLTKMWYGKKYAVLASILFAVAPLPIIYSRLSYAYGVSMFFTIASVFAIEYLIRKKHDKRRELILIFASGTLIGLTLLTRFNSLPIFFLYWLFVLSYSFFKEKNCFRKYLYYAFILNLIALVSLIAIVLSFGGIPRLIYIFHNFLFVIQQQSTQLLNPYYYHIAVLFDGISPFLYVLLPFAFLYLLINKKTTRTDIMLFFLVFVFFIIITIQARRFSRHQLVIYPFLIILLSRFIAGFSSNYMKKISAIAVSAVIVLGTLSWTLFIIYQTHDFNVWTKVGDYIEKNYDKSVKIHSGYIRNRQIKTHVPRDIDSSLRINALNKGDLVIFAFLNENSTILENSPFEDKSTLFENKFAAKRSRNLEFSPDYYKYVLEHGALVKTFDYKKGTAVWIYKMNDVKDKNLYPYKELIGTVLKDTKLFGLWDVICTSWNKGNLIDIVIKKILSSQQSREISAKCLG